MKKFIGVKIVLGKPMTLGEYNKYRGWVIPPNENPKMPGYLVEYPPDPSSEKNHTDHEGYISWSPKGAFDKAYRRTDGMPFGFAIEALKKDLKVAREGWNGKDMFLKLIPGNNVKVEINSCFKIVKPGDEAELPVLDFIVMKTATDEYIPGWLASQTDMLAEDWFIVE